MTAADCDPNDLPVVAWAFVAMARGGRVSIVAAQLHANPTTRCTQGELFT